MDKPSRYRRGFEFRIVRGDTKSLERGIEAFLRLSVPEYAEVLEDYLETGRKRRDNRTALAKLQLHLLDDLAGAEGMISHYKKKIETCKATPSAATDERRASTNKELEQDEFGIFFHRAHANCIRSIGDGLAWRALGYDRAAILALCQNPVKPRVITEGAQQELHKWSSSFDAGSGVAILNSITNCLSVGDVTVVKDDGTVEIVEVKTGTATSRRLTRQRRKMRETAMLLSSGVGKLDYPEVEIIRTEIYPENGLRDLSAALDEAVLNGWSTRRLSDFLLVECHNFQKIEDFDELRNVTKDARRTLVKDWTRRSDRVLPNSTLNCMEFSPNHAPFSIFPFGSQVCVALLTGGMEFVSFLNISAIERSFERHGWKIEKRPEDLLAERGSLQTGFWTVAKGGLHTTIAPSEIARMAFETVLPGVIIQVLDERFKIGLGAMLSHVFTAYSREREMWD